jgi:hypothetical protein
MNNQQLFFSIIGVVAVELGAVLGVVLAVMLHMFNNLQTEMRNLRADMVNIRERLTVIETSLGMTKEKVG